MFHSVSPNIKWFPFQIILSQLKLSEQLWRWSLKTFNCHILVFLPDQLGGGGGGGGIFLKKKSFETFFRKLHF